MRVYTYTSHGAERPLHRRQNNYSFFIIFIYFKRLAFSKYINLRSASGALAAIRIPGAGGSLGPL